MMFVPGPTPNPASVVPLLSKEQSAQITNLAIEAFRKSDSESAERTLAQLAGNGNIQLMDAEAMVLTGVASVNRITTRITDLFPGIDPFNNSQTICQLAEAARMIGSITFSFPNWRVPAQPFSVDSAPAESMFEHAGMVKTVRPTDKFPAPDSQQRQDWLGSGYLKPETLNCFSDSGNQILKEKGLAGSDIFIEYRRSYILITAPSMGSLLIRNSSPFFGRDNFKYSAYYSPETLTKEEIHNLNPCEIDSNQTSFSPVVSAGNFWNTVNSKNLANLTRLFNSFNEGLFGTGFQSGIPVSTAKINSLSLLKCLKSRLEKLPGNAPPPLLSVINNEDPPWKPVCNLNVSKSVLEELEAVASGKAPASAAVRIFLKEAASPGRAVVMLNSAEGDLPASKKTSNNDRNEALVNFLRARAQREMAELGSTKEFPILGSDLFPSLRKIDLPSTLDNIVDWLAQEIKDAPGLIVSLSGTDSMLTFILCSKALEKLNKDPHKHLIGIHYQTASPDEASYPNDWLRKFGSLKVLPQPSFEQFDADIKRWSNFSAFGINNERLWMIGTRNASEIAIADYSLFSNQCTIYPLSKLFKTEILNACFYLGVPLKEINRSLAPDPECNVACPFQNRRVVQTDYLIFKMLGLLAENDIFEVSSDIQRLFNERIKLGDFRRSHVVPSDQIIKLQH